MDKLVEMYTKYHVTKVLASFPFSGNYVREQFAQGVMLMLQRYTADIIFQKIYNKHFENNKPNVIITIGSGGINDDTDSELYMILYVPLTEVPDILILLYDDDIVQDIYKQIADQIAEQIDDQIADQPDAQPINQDDPPTNSIVFAVSLKYDYSIIFQMPFITYDVLYAV
jgi:hypothetical protein